VDNDTGVVLVDTVLCVVANVVDSVDGVVGAVVGAVEGVVGTVGAVVISGFVGTRANFGDAVEIVVSVIVGVEDVGAVVDVIDVVVVVVGSVVVDVVSFKVGSVFLCVGVVNAIVDDSVIAVVVKVVSFSL
jgi:hypothetical protein